MPDDTNAISINYDTTLPTFVDLKRANSAACRSPNFPFNLPPDTRLKRRDLVTAINAAGFPLSIPTLNTMASRGGGPPFSKFSNTPLYRWADALAWAQSRSTKVVYSTSELENQPSPA